LAKISNFLQILGILNSVLKPNISGRQSQVKIYNILAAPSLSYVCEFWTLKQMSIKGLKTAEMKFTRGTAGYSSLDRKRNDGTILEELKQTQQKRN
jgi:hypothetical protein